MIWCVTPNPALDVAYQLGDPVASRNDHRAVEDRVGAGGKGNNVARSLRQLGIRDVTAVMPLGGAVGRAVADLLADCQIPVLSTGVEGNTRVCIGLVHGAEAIEVRGAGPVVSPMAWEDLMSTLVERTAPDDWVVFSGSLPPGLESDSIGWAVAHLRRRVAGVAADLSGPSLAAAAAAGASVITPNQKEYADMATMLPPPTAYHLIITRGADGLSWTPPGGPRRLFRAAPVRPVNTVGAGDAFLAGLVDALARHETWELALRWGLAVAGSAVELFGVGDVSAERARVLYEATDW